MEYAKRGWVAITLEYRRGNLQDSQHVAATLNNNLVRYTSVYTVAAIYKGSQDTRGAYNSVIKRELNHNSFPGMKYRIDTSAIFVGGASAGSLLTMTAVYYQKQYMMDSIAPGAKAVFGSINYPYYYGDSTIDYTKYIKGCMNMWGEWILPLGVLSNISAFFRQDRSIAPMIAFCGGKDSTFYPLQQNYYYDTARNFLGLGIDMKKTTYCLPFAASYELFPHLDRSRDFVGYGSLKIYNLLKSANIPVNLYYDCDAFHGFETACKTCPFVANYGTAYTDELMMEKYFAERSITYFQQVLLDSARFLNDTKFTDCENYIVTCRTKDSNCHNNDACPNNFGIDDGGDDGGVWQSLKQNNTDKTEFYENNTNTMLLPVNKRSFKSPTRKP